MTGGLSPADVDVGRLVLVAKRLDYSTAYGFGGRHTEPRRIPIRCWLENGLTMLLAAAYSAAMARVMDALPHDELT